MPSQEPTSASRTSPFKAIKHTDEDGEFWSAREPAKLLEYSRWQKFTPVLEKSEEACRNSGQRVEDHLHRSVQMVALGSGAQREVEDYHLSRYACYLIVQNADPSKRIVALGQAYFAIQTRRQELADALAGKTAEQQRLLLRDQAAEENGHLAETASAAGTTADAGAVHPADSPRGDPAPAYRRGGPPWSLRAASRA